MYVLYCILMRGSPWELHSSAYNDDLEEGDESDRVERLACAQVLARNTLRSHNRVIKTNAIPLNTDVRLQEEQTSWVKVRPSV